MDKPKSDCLCKGHCCNSDSFKKKIEIDFLYLDLNTCQRCQGTESNLDKALNELSSVLALSGYEVQANKINIITPELAIKYRFISSPTIRVNGVDIAMKFTETSCEDCGDICGESTDCRSWVIDGVEHSIPPIEFIISSILKVVFGNLETDTEHHDTYELPDNLLKFYEGIKK